MHKDPEKRREYAREYWRKSNNKGTTVDRTPAFGDFPYRVVPKTWRDRVAKRLPYHTEVIDSAMVRDLLGGKTILVDYEVPLGSSSHPFRTLYSYFTARGMRLRIHIVDDLEKNEYRRLLMWAERF